MWTRLHITVFVGIAVIIWVFLILLSGVTITAGSLWSILYPFGTVVSILLLIGLIFDRYLWHWPFLHGWFVKRPDMRGTWRVQIVSNWVPPHRKSKPIDPITAFIGIEQTFSKLNIHLMTADSESWLDAVEIRPSPKSSGYQIAGVYSNEPKSALRGTSSERHRGALILWTSGPNHGKPQIINGEYWTDRESSGILYLTDRKPQILTLYNHAESEFNE